MHLSKLLHHRWKSTRGTFQLSSSSREAPDLRAWIIGQERVPWRVSSVIQTQNGRWYPEDCNRSSSERSVQSLIIAANLARCLPCRCPAPCFSVAQEVFTTVLMLLLICWLVRYGGGILRCSCDRMVANAGPARRRFSDCLWPEIRLTVGLDRFEDPAKLRKSIGESLLGRRSWMERTASRDGHEVGGDDF